MTRSCVSFHIAAEVIQVTDNLCKSNITVQGIVATMQTTLLLLVVCTQMSMCCTLRCPSFSLNSYVSDFGLSYAKNGELLKYIRKIGSFDETCTRFYSAEIVSALEYLHAKGIIHRWDSSSDDVMLFMLTAPTFCIHSNAYLNDTVGVNAHAIQNHPNVWRSFGVFRSW